MQGWQPGLDKPIKKPGKAWSEEPLGDALRVPEARVTTLLDSGRRHALQAGGRRQKWARTF